MLEIINFFVCEPDGLAIRKSLGAHKSVVSIQWSQTTRSKGGVGTRVNMANVSCSQGMKPELLARQRRKVSGTSSLPL